MVFSRLGARSPSGARLRISVPQKIIKVEKRNPLVLIGIINNELQRKIEVGKGKLIPIFSPEITFCNLKRSYFDQGDSQKRKRNVKYSVKYIWQLLGKRHGTPSVRYWCSRLPHVCHVVILLMS